MYVKKKKSLKGRCAFMAVNDRSEYGRNVEM